MPGREDSAGELGREEAGLRRRRRRRWSNGWRHRRGSGARSNGRCDRWNWRQAWNGRWGRRTGDKRREQGKGRGGGCDRALHQDLLDGYRPFELAGGVSPSILRVDADVVLTRAWNSRQTPFSSRNTTGSIRLTHSPYCVAEGWRPSRATSDRSPATRCDRSKMSTSAIPRRAARSARIALMRTIPAYWLTGSP
jgi:hypothetical protein